jgi:hypothetical protein
VQSQDVPLLYQRFLHLVALRTTKTPPDQAGLHKKAFSATGMEINSGIVKVSDAISGGQILSAGSP